jgi:hypothetical protein
MVGLNDRPLFTLHSSINTFNGDSIHV